MKTFRYFLAVSGVLVFVGLSIFIYKKDKKIDSHNFVPVKQQITAVPTISITPTATPTPKPLTFAEMNQLYGPCVSVPILMFHHVQDLKTAEEEGHLSLTVGIEYFKKDLEYLAAKGYTTITPADLIAFFDNGIKLPAKPVMLTFDDGYADNGTEMFEALKTANMKAVIFIPTGLMDNPGYLSWEKISEMKGSGLVYFGNHTWSHRNVGGSLSVIEYEAKTADTQLNDHGLNADKVFAYPYGVENGQAVKLLKSMDYKLAFTTVYGRVQCAKKRYELPRIRIGNAPLSSYGL